MSNTAQDFERLITFIRDLGGRARAPDHRIAEAPRLVA
jgi:hypothetical protein